MNKYHTKKVWALCLIAEEIREFLCFISLLLLATMKRQLEGNNKNSVNRMWAAWPTVIFCFQLLVSLKLSPNSSFYSSAQGQYTPTTRKSPTSETSWILIHCKLISLELDIFSLICSDSPLSCLGRIDVTVLVGAMLFPSVKDLEPTHQLQLVHSGSFCCVDGSHNVGQTSSAATKLCLLFARYVNTKTARTLNMSKSALSHSHGNSL